MHEDTTRLTLRVIEQFFRKLGSIPLLSSAKYRSSSLSTKSDIIDEVNCKCICYQFAQNALFHSLQGWKNDLYGRPREFHTTRFRIVQPAFSRLPSRRPMKLVHPLRGVVSKTRALPRREYRCGTEKRQRTWHSRTTSLRTPLATRIPIFCTTFINLGCPLKRTLGQPSCFPAIDGTRCTFTFDQSHRIPSSSRDCKGRFGCFQILRTTFRNHWDRTTHTRFQ